MSKIQPKEENWQIYNYQTDKSTLGAYLLVVSLLSTVLLTKIRTYQNCNQKIFLKSFQCHLLRMTKICKGNE